ncbi:MAG: 16S rRNA (cytidine1402-2'-O)-methyltransferase [Oleiphilaceae bacterium]
MRLCVLESAIYIVATPIGNLSDITLRALEVLTQVDVIAAEDTRHTRKLLDHHGISTRMASLHEHNEAERAAAMLEKIAVGGSLALVSDAGTPLISDPGHVLVSLAHELGVKVVTIPGPSAVISALSVCGVPCGRFVFEGFLPAKKKAKTDVLMSYEYEKKAVVFYESPHRILDTLETMYEVFGDRVVGVARELTKRFETVRRDKLSEIVDWVRADLNQQKGEFVLVLHGSDAAVLSASDAEKEKLLARLLLELPPKKASAVVADLLGGAKKEIYNLALKLKEKKK